MGMNTQEAANDEGKDGVRRPNIEYKGCMQVMGSGRRHNGEGAPQGDGWVYADERRRLHRLGKGRGA